MRKRRPADGAEGPAVPCRWQGEACDMFLTREPRQRGCAGEEIGGVGRPGVLSAVRAMTQVEAFEVSRDLEPDVCTETSSGMNIQAEHLPDTQRLRSRARCLSMIIPVQSAHQTPPDSRMPHQLVGRQCTGH
jgi:hypothetical protein